MKTVSAIHFFHFFRNWLPALAGPLLLLTGPVAGQPLPPVGASSGNFWQAVAPNLENGDLDQVEARLQQARSEAAKAKDKETKARITEAQRQLRKFYDPLFQNLYWSNDQRQKGQWRNAQIEINEALQRIESHRQGGMPEFSQVDQRLEDRVKQEHQLVSQQRQSLYLERMRQGEQLLWSQRYEQAIPALQEAKALLLEDQEQAEVNRIDELIRQAQYRQFIAKGEEAEQKGDFKGALDFYLQAQQIMDNAEVQGKIQEVTSRLHFALLAEAKAAIESRNYAEAAAKLDQAAAYRSSDVLNQLRNFGYQQLRDGGNAAFDAGQYDRALEAFQQARLFIDNDAIRADINRAKNVKAYQAELEKANALIQQEKLTAARSRLKRAARYNNSEAVQQRLLQLDTYAGKVRQGKSFLKTDPTAAYQQFAEAYKLFPTAEAREWMSRAEAAGGKGQGTGGNDFFKL